MSKKPHPSIAITEEKMIAAIRVADRFEAVIFIGRGRYAHGTALTVQGALNIARELELDERAHTRRATISAISADGYATFLTPALIRRLKKASQ
jgi:hypothetical protein